MVKSSLFRPTAASLARAKAVKSSTKAKQMAKAISDSKNMKTRRIQKTSKREQIKKKLLKEQQKKASTPRIQKEEQKENQSPVPAAVPQKKSSPVCEKKPLTASSSKTPNAQVPKSTPVPAAAPQKKSSVATSNSGPTKKFKARPLDPKIYSSFACGQHGVPNYKSKKPTVARSPRLGKKRSPSNKQLSKKVLQKGLKDVTNRAAKEIAA